MSLKFLNLEILLPLLSLLSLFIWCFCYLTLTATIQWRTTTQNRVGSNHNRVPSAINYYSCTNWRTRFANHRRYTDFNGINYTCEYLHRFWNNNNIMWVPDRSPVKRLDFNLTVCLLIWPLGVLYNISHHIYAIF